MKLDLIEYVKHMQDTEYFTRLDYTVFTMFLNYCYKISYNENKPIIDSFVPQFPFDLNIDEEDEEVYKLKKYWLKQITGASQFVLLTYGLDLVYEDMKIMLKSKNIEQLKKQSNIFNLMPKDEQVKLTQNYKNIKQKIIEQLGTSSGINDFAIIKALRNSICHNDEDHDLYNLRSWGGGELDLRLTFNGKKIKLNLTVNELEKLCSFYIELMDINGGCTWIYKIVDDKYKPYWGFIYDDKTIDITDRHQQSYLNRIGIAYKKLGTPIRMVHYPSKEDAGLYAYEIFTIFKLMSVFFKECDRPILPILMDNMDNPNVYLDIESPVERMIVIINLALLRYLLTSKSSEYYANIVQEKIKSNMDAKKDKTESNINLYINKIRNSLVHGRFFIDLIGKKCVFYDEPIKELSLKSKKMSNQQAELYKEYIERGEAVDKVKNLVCIGEISLTNLTDLVKTCVGQSIKKTRIKNVLNKSNLVNQDYLYK